MLGDLSCERSWGSKSRFTVHREGFLQSKTPGFLSTFSWGILGMLDLDSRMESSTHLISSSCVKTMVQGFETSISGAGIFPSTQKKDTV